MHETRNQPSDSVFKTPSSDFRVYLQCELVRRRRLNPSYSLRRFAAHLAVDPSVLSKLLAKKRSVTRRMFVHIADRLGLSPEVRAKLDPILAREGQLSPANETYRTIEMDQFHLISDWYHYAILELTSVRGFRPDIQWIGKTLRIGLPEAKAAIERLFRLGMLKEKNGRWIDLSGSVTTIGGLPTHSALREMQKQILKLGIAALDEIEPDFRDHGSMTMAINSENLPAAKALIRAFRRELCSVLQTGQRRDAVMQLSTALFPVTQFTGPRRKK